MTTNKTVTIADTQLLVGGGDVTRDALGLSIGSELSKVLETYLKSEKSPFADGIKTGYEYNYRLIGSDAVETDKHWLSFVYGGTYAEESYEGIFVNQTFLDHHHIEHNPYSEIEVRQNGTFTTRSPNYISCKPEINAYHRLYINSIDPSTDVTTIANGYLLTRHLGASLGNFLDAPTRLRQLLTSTARENIIEDFELGKVQTRQTSSLLKNIFVTSNDIYDDISQVNQASDVLPHYVKTSFNFDGTGNFLKEVSENNFEHRFIKILKDSFLSQDEAPAPTNVNFSLSIEQFDKNTEIETITNTSELRVVDVFDLMSYSLTDYNTSNSDFFYLFDDSETAKSQYNNNSIRRFEKTIPTIKQANSLINLLNSPTFLSTFETNPINLEQKYNEVVAYRIEKIGGSVTGDRFTQDAIQNFWFLNSDDVERLEFLDNQVIFNQDYTYRIYKYVLIAGLEYTYSDLSVTRTIANLDRDHDTSSAGWCLEFFDPETGDSSSPLYNDGSGAVAALGTTLATDAQVTSPVGQQYLADFKLKVLPSVKIVEVPLFEKQISIVDSPTNYVQVSPTFTLDDSNRLIFKIRYGAKTSFKMPTSVTAEDADYSQKFMTSYDIMDDDLITTNGISLPINLEIYRIEQMPNSLSDFNGNLYKTISMKIPNENATFRTTIVADKVHPNKKYFYFFRVVNEAENFGVGSNIIEAELVSDGGYKFANFEAYFENELGPPPFSRTIKSFKKLLNISPSIDNLIIDDSSADYTDLAKNQVQNINFGASQDSLWGKKYKIRLTSKKTGKKIDINITHKLVG